jgi:hypothetical protein
MRIFRDIFEILFALAIPTALCVGGVAWLETTAAGVYGVALGMFVVYVVFKCLDNAPIWLDRNLRDCKYELSQTKKTLDARIKDCLKLRKKEISQKDWVAKQNNILADIEKGLSDREKICKWLAPLVADIRLVLQERNRLPADLIKTERDYEARTKVNVLRAEKKKLLEDKLFLEYQLEYIRTLIPEVDDIVGYEDVSEETADESSWRLPKDEYEKLSDTEKSKLSLERYKSRKRSAWEIGRDFEMYIGYTYELRGYDVEYFGIEKKLEDLGRDLIAKKGTETLIIQCKYWSKNKTIHEKHIAQLFGTVKMYEMENPSIIYKAAGVFVSHTALSDEAKKFARALEIQIEENVEQGDYPMIKCNIGRDVEKIYHLPGDQQYDTTKISKAAGEFYAFTVEEAEEKGYRRAWRWHGD